MEIKRAKEIVRLLADGIDPHTGEVLSDESVYNKPEVIRALYTLLNAVPEEIERDPLRNAGKSLRNAGKSWTEIEDDKLRDEFSAKMKVSEIAKEHGRTRNAIESRLDLLGLKKKPFWLFKKK